MSGSTGQPNLINITREFLLVNSRISCRASFGYSCKDVNAAVSLLREVAENAFHIADLFPILRAPIALFTRVNQNVNKVYQKLNKFLDHIINEHEAAKAANININATTSEGVSEESLLDMLLKLRESNEHSISMTNVKATIWVSFVYACIF